MPASYSLRGLHSGLSPPGVVQIVDREKPRAKTLIVGASQGTFSGETEHVDVILHQHDVAHVVGGVEASHGVADHQELHTQELHDSDGESTLPQWVSLDRSWLISLTTRPPIFLPRTRVAGPA